MISPDLPITKARDDILNRSSFAKNLAKVLLEYSCSSSFSIGLYGEWGSGKTSLLNMVIEEIEDKDSRVVILRFNPWLCSDSKQLISQFFKQLATAIKMNKTATDKACELIDQYADIFDATSAIPLLGDIIAAACKTAAQQAKQHIEKANDLQTIKNKIVEKLEEENLKIIVAIDDIDRLSEEEIIAVFQLVKSLADFPNTIYLLAFDYKVVIQALKKCSMEMAKSIWRRLFKFLLKSLRQALIQSITHYFLNLILLSGILRIINGIEKLGQDYLSLE